MCGRGFPLLQGSAHGRPCRLWVRQSPWHSWEDDTSGTSPGRAPCRAAKRPGPMGGAAVWPRELPKGPAPAVTSFPKSSGFKQVHYLTALEVRNPKSVLGANNVWAGRAGSFRGLSRRKVPLPPPVLGVPWLVAPASTFQRRAHPHRLSLLPLEKPL